MKALRQKYTACLEALGLAPVDYPLATKPGHDGSPHVEISGDAYHFVITERGKEYERKRTRDVDAICYWLIRGVVSYWALRFELQHRVEGLDSRYIAFDCEEKMMARISAAWQNRIYHEHEACLQHPYPVPEQVARKAGHWPP